MESFAFESMYLEHLEGLKQQSAFRTVESGLMPSPQAGFVHIDGKDYLNLASNDYLGLSKHPYITAAGHQALNIYGNGSASARIVSGHFECYTAIEQKLADFKGKQAALIGASGYQVNSAVLSCLLNPALFAEPPLVFFDKYNHASLYAGLAMIGITPIRYRHNDLNHLKTLLQKYADGKRPIFCITESLFSMDGDFLDIPAFTTLAKQYHAMTIIDDAHAIGLYGQNGRGLCFGQPNIDIVLGTFSKACGVFGGYVACNQTLAHFIRNKAGGLIYSTALPPMIWKMIEASLDVILQADSERQMLHDLIDKSYPLFKRAGFDCMNASSQIIPLNLCDNKRALTAQNILREAGFFIKAIRSPTVPPKTARLRLSLTPFIKINDIKQIIRILQENLD